MGQIKKLTLGTQKDGSRVLTNWTVSWQERKNQDRWKERKKAPGTVTINCRRKEGPSQAPANPSHISHFHPL